MKDTSKHALLLEAYSYLEDVTPKKYDCGMLCSAACCAENKSHGDDGECGMLLLPGERELLEGAQGFEFFSSGEGELLVCGGKCVREIRPFACRIFPFYPKIEKTGKRLSVRILPDPRCRRLCPICSDFRKRKTHITFLRNAKKAVRILLKDQDIVRELMSLSEMLEDIEKLRSALLGSDR